MSVLRGWSEEGATDEELRLLEVSRRERPDPSARARTLFALGLAGAPDVSPRSNGVTAGRAGTATKLVLLAVVGGAAVVGAAWFGRRHPTPTGAIATAVSAPVVLPVATPPASDPVAPRPVVAAAADSVAPPRLLERQRPGHAPARRSVRVAPALSPLAAPVAVSTLSAEVAALEQAQVALAAQDAERALLALQRYRARFPAGRLASEETVLHVQALLARGDQDAANALANRFFAAHPDSSYADRVRDLLHDTEEKQKKQ